MYVQNGIIGSPETMDVVLGFIKEKKSYLAWISI